MSPEKECPFCDRNWTETINIPVQIENVPMGECPHCGRYRTTDIARNRISGAIESLKIDGKIPESAISGPKNNRCLMIDFECLPDDNVGESYREKFCI